jgi:hypothetical protein
MNSSQKAGKSKSSKTKKGGNFLGAVGDLVAPTGWGSFATAAVLVGMDQADSALRRKKSEKSSAKKGGMRGGAPMDEAKLIQQNNANLINSFLRLCGRAFILENRESLFLKLNTLIEKEIKYREKIIKLIEDEEMRAFLTNSLKDLNYIKIFVKREDKNHANYMQLGEYRQKYRNAHPNLKTTNLPKHNNTLSNLETKYSNKNKYPN